MDTQVEEGCIESSNYYPIDEEEHFLKLKDKVLDVIEDDQYTFDPNFFIDEYIKEGIEKYKRHTM
jgi:hypothetical protein